MTQPQKVSVSPGSRGFAAAHHITDASPGWNAGPYHHQNIRPNLQGVRRWKFHQRPPCCPLLSPCLQAAASDQEIIGATDRRIIVRRKFATDVRSLPLFFEPAQALDGKVDHSSLKSTPHLQRGLLSYVHLLLGDRRKLRRQNSSAGRLRGE